MPVSTVISAWMRSAVPGMGEGTDQSRAVRSREAVAITGRSRRKTRGEDLLVVRERLTERTGSGRVPEPGRFGTAERQHDGRIAIEDGAVDHVGVLHGFADRPAGVTVPDLCRSIEAAGQDPLAVGAESDAPDITADASSGSPTGFMVWTSQIRAVLS